jgi:hypothetical protein
MKVLQPGKGWQLHVKCTGKGNGDGGCGAKLLVEKDDVYQTYSYDIDGFCNHYFTICCPQCGIETDIDDKLIPDSVKRNTLTKKEYDEIHNNEKVLVK